MVVLSAKRNSYVAAQNMELTGMRPAQLKNMLKSSYLIKKFKIFKSADSSVSSLSDEV